MNRWRSVFSLIFIVSILGLILMGCAAAPAPTATPLPPTATPEPTAEASTATDEVLLVTGEFAPFTSEALDGGGMITEIVTAAFDEMGRLYRVEYYPWERAEAMVESGEAWGTFPYVPTDERRERFMVSENLANSETYLYYYGDAMRDVTYEELADLREYRMGVSLGYWYIPLFEEAGLNIDPANDDLANLRKLAAGRIDLLPMLNITGQWLIQTEFAANADQFGFLSKPVATEDPSSIQNTVIASRQYAGGDEILSDFNAALATIIENGVYGEIVAKYGLNVDQLFSGE